MATAAGGDGQAAGRSASTSDPDAGKILDIVVYLRDRSGIYFNLEDGHLARSDELLNLVIEEQGLTAEAREVFSLWLVSPMLEIRLKKHHIPYQVVQYWDELCMLYTDEKPEEINKIEPVLMVQRNPFYPKDLEQNITNEQILCLLYHEAKFNVLEGRYVLPPSDLHELAGVQALIHMGRYDPRSHPLEEYRSSLFKFYPEHMYAKKKSFFGKKEEPEEVPCETRFQNSHEHLSEEFHVDDVEKILPDLYRRYLQICWSHPFYGSAFFHGDVETPCSSIRKLIRKPEDTDVWIAINCESVSIIDKHKHELMLSVPLTQLSWEFQDEDFDVDGDSDPCLFLQFPYAAEGSNSVTKLLRIFSQQARLMDALINSCVERKKHAIMGYDFVDGQVLPGVKRDSNRMVLNRLDKLCLETFTKEGEKVDETV